MNLTGVCSSSLYWLWAVRLWLLCIMGYVALYWTLGETLFPSFITSFFTVFFKDTQSDPRSTASVIFSLFCYSTSPPLTAFFFHADFPLFSPFFPSPYHSVHRLHPFQVHSSCFLVFNLASSPSPFSPAAPCNANTTCSEGKWIIETTAAIPSVHNWAAEEGRRERMKEWVRMKEMLRLDW